ncbi:MAG: thiamine-binding protein [Flavipsychrobacter sp.]|nr:thiamine-binding protein [Flavipsychrobacter sp.]
MHNIINLAIQVLPLYKEQPEGIRIIDRAIECIQQSGLKYVVCPFETVVEGEYDTVMKLVKDIHEVCYAAGAASLIMNMKLQSSVMAVAIDDKIGKYAQ